MTDLSVSHTVLGTILPAVNLPGTDWTYSYVPVFEYIPENGIAANRQLSRQKPPEFFDCLVISDHSEDQNRS